MEIYEKARQKNTKDCCYSGIFRMKLITEKAVQKILKLLLQWKFQNKAYY